jgi:hypothetical protein
MTTRLTFTDRLKALFLGLINGNNLALTKSRSYEVEILTSPTQRWSPQNPQSGVHTIKEEASVATRFLSSRVERFWSANRGGGRDVEHTRSNLG